ncbi:MAG: hypothetical protein A2937_02115 [Candidatus Yonathbacteria bacterium RIFCSPLOWO2_01_FULL_47_33b]|uniref:Methyltransferase type 12 domain-containing protein n=1 Tax=Candidatus Yonathbacteria bacterium RIFCSPLOWO2_01_FULL_47_33b TaxID=1802727 RepID=A0A1G2SI32_9BACT|nr:MAG: hypothetical protein A2937_02115 [Candidatus Yonathbacteria bacterium RIFCSPLOWO2_01_FULL_47_33b]
MNDDDSKRIIGFYEDTLNTYGNDARSVHWADTETQRVRFEVLNGVAALGNKSVLDVGCGLGDLYKFFISKEIPVEYTGIDIVPAFVDRARERFPGAVFSVEDIFSVRGEYDYVLASGALNFMVADSKQYYFSMIKKMFELSKKGLAFNMLNNAEHPTDDTLVSYDIDEVTAYCKTLSDHVVMTRGYLPWDFTVYMYKE